MNDSELDALLKEARTKIDTEGLYPARLFGDRTLWDRERHNVFGKSWVYLGHVSELTEANSYMVRSIVDDQFIVTKDKDGTIRALHNSCRHRGMQVCRADTGRAARFTCPYHGWTFSNTGKLLAMPTGKDLYSDGFKKEDWGLKHLPGLEIFHGLIFGSLNPDVEPLKDYLGPMAWYLELMVARTKEGLEVRGAPNRSVVNGDWKIAADNFVGDAFHTATTHASMLGGRDPLFASNGHQVVCGNGHALGHGSAFLPDGNKVTSYGGLPEEMWPEIHETLLPEQAEMLKDTLHFHGNVFPNFSFLQVLEAPAEDAPPTSMLTLRVWHPLENGKLEICSWFLVDKSAPEEHKQSSYEAYLRCFGSGGCFEADDAENWRSISRMSKGQFSEDNYYNYQLGQDCVAPNPEWTGPGTAYPRAYAEIGQRHFHGHWMDMMLGGK